MDRLWVKSELQNKVNLELTLLWSLKLLIGYNGIKVQYLSPKRNEVQYLNKCTYILSLQPR